MLTDTFWEHRIQKKIQEYNALSFFENKRIVIFGSNPYVPIINSCIKDAGYRVDAVLDNNELKCGKKIDDIEIVNPEEYLSENHYKMVFLIFSKYSDEMIRQLVSLGIFMDEILCLSDNKPEFNDSQEVFLKNMYGVQDGYRNYLELEAGFEDERYLMVRHTPATGDVYLSCMFLKEFALKNKIKNYSLVLVSNGCRRIAEMFGYENVVVVDTKVAKSIIDAWVYLGDSYMKVFPLMSMAYRTKERFHYEDYNLINFRDLFCKELCGLPDDTEGEKPQFASDDEYVNIFFDKNHLLRGKTAILAPYAGSINSQIPIDFWNLLAEKLKDFGYTVCTNCGRDSEKPIEGTCAAFFDYEHGKPILEQAGVFISVRNGLCDILSSAECRQFILYEDGYSHSLNYDLFSIRKMGLNSWANEYRYSANDETDVINDILSKINTDGNLEHVDAMVMNS